MVSSERTLRIVVPSSWARPSTHDTPCDTIDHGYTCNPSLTHHFGQYSPFFSVPSQISTATPPTCRITFAQILARHGGRFPTAGRSTAYANLVNRIQSYHVGLYPPKYRFLARYEYSLGSEALTAFGQQQMVNAGEKFYAEYRELARVEEPFYRTAAGSRVIESALKFSQGFAAASTRDGTPRKPVASERDMVVISEEETANNTLSHSTCPAFEHSHPTWSQSAEAQWANIFVPPIRDRISSDLEDMPLSNPDTIALMDLCPFETIAAIDGQLSPFCQLFTEEEFRQYDYYQSLNKYYGYSFGSPLAPTQGVGFVNELIARLTRKPVRDATNTNSTLDNNATTFPLDRKLYADFSHDNDMVSIFAALGLYNTSTTPALRKTSMTNAEEAGGFAASWLVPFAGRLVVETMTCDDNEEDLGRELVRVFVNDRVMPLQGCDADALGRCDVGRWIESLAFARTNGRWGECYN
jgi:hypothetical protein